MDNAWSSVFQVNFGVRQLQNSVLSPVWFAVYLDDLGKLCSPMDSCYIILYADDILLISPSVTYTERLLHRCEQEQLQEYNKTATIIVKMRFRNELTANYTSKTAKVTKR